MLAVLCVRGGRAIDFRVMVGRLVGEAMGAFGALNLPSEKCPVIPNARADGRWSGGYLSAEPKRPKRLPTCRPHCHVYFYF